MGQSIVISAAYDPICYRSAAGFHDALVAAVLDMSFICPGGNHFVDLVLDCHGMATDVNAARSKTRHRIGR